MRRACEERDAREAMSGGKENDSGEDSLTCASVQHASLRAPLLPLQRGGRMYRVIQGHCHCSFDIFGVCQRVVGGCQAVSVNLWWRLELSCSNITWVPMGRALVRMQENKIVRGTHLLECAEFGAYSRENGERE